MNCGPGTKTPYCCFRGTVLSAADVSAIKKHRKEINKRLVDNWNKNEDCMKFIDDSCAPCGTKVAIVSIDNGKGCAFLTRMGEGYGCALHKTATELGVPVENIKPVACVKHPNGGPCRFCRKRGLEVRK